MLPSEAQLLAAAKPSATRKGIPAARLLHFARRLERNLLSYERVGWTDMPAITLAGLASPVHIACSLTPAAEQPTCSRPELAAAALQPPAAELRALRARSSPAAIRPCC